MSLGSAFKRVRGSCYGRWSGLVRKESEDDLLKVFYIAGKKSPRLSGLYGALKTNKSATCHWSFASREATQLAFY